MAGQVSIGNQSFEDMRETKAFYVDKTSHISTWWNSGVPVTLITRPRRFGKTLFLDTVNQFFSSAFQNQQELFDGLAVWRDPAMRDLAGTIPVISLTFADVKAPTCEDAKALIKAALSEVIDQFDYLIDSSALTAKEQNYFRAFSMEVSDAVSLQGLKNLSAALYKHHGVRPIILLDEYDTPLLEAWEKGYWDELISYIRPLMNSTFKTNKFIRKALLTGITRISKESIFSDLNNMHVISTTTSEYETAFGFTQEEVFQAMDDFGLTDKDAVRDWYDGFTFGQVRDIYNPWSITCYLREKKLKPYWMNTSSNLLIGREVKSGGIGVKSSFERLLQGLPIRAAIKEEIAFPELGSGATALWSLMLASGYLRIAADNRDGTYDLQLTNREVREGVQGLVEAWFTDRSTDDYDVFVRALLACDVETMNLALQRLALEMFSFFDAGFDQPERFYHGFVLGLLVTLRKRYVLTSNRESGFGRYDIMLEPLDREHDKAFVLEFKVCTSGTPEAALKEAKEQIEDRRYATALIARGIAPEKIHAYGIVFDKKRVLVG